MKEDQRDATTKYSSLGASEGDILGDCDNKGFEWTAVFPRSGYSGHEYDNPTLADPRLVHPPHHFTQTNSRPRVNDILSSLDIQQHLK